MAWIGGAIAAGGSLLGGMMSSDAAGEAANAQRDASGASIAEQRRQYDLTRGDTAPSRDAGNASLARLRQLLGLGGAGSVVDKDLNGKPIANKMRYDTDPAYRQAWDAVQAQHNAQYTEGYQPTSDASWIEREVQSRLPTNGDDGSLVRKFSASDLTNDPVYNSGLKFGLDRGTEGINARATANGMYDSGATLKALTQFGNDYGSTKANESFNRYNATNDSIYNKLMGINSGGQASTAQVAAAGTNTANNVSGSMDAAGNARAAGIVGGANAWGSGIQGAAQGYNNYNNNQQLMALLKNRNTGTPTQSFDPYGIS